MNEENGNFTSSNIVISEPTITLPPSHQFTIFERGRFVYGNDKVH